MQSPSMSKNEINIYSVRSESKQNYPNDQRFWIHTIFTVKKQNRTLLVKFLSCSVRYYYEDLLCQIRFNFFFTLSNEKHG